MRKAIILYGPPGGGKGTQSELIVENHRMVNFDTGSYLETLFYHSDKKDSPTIKRERKLFDSGKLNTPSWVLGIVKERVSSIADSGSGVVLSGSPRTALEAFGDRKTKGLMKVLEQKYGKKNILIFELMLKESGSVNRNASRLVCSLCKNSVLGKYYSHLKICPFCGAKLVKRTLDTPDVIKKRLGVYKERTWPIINELKKKGYKVVQIDASPMPSKVFEQINRHIK